MNRYRGLEKVSLFHSCLHLAQVLAMLDRGCPPDSADYDNRTALMLAAAQGHKVRLGQSYQCYLCQAA